MNCSVVLGSSYSQESGMYVVSEIGSMSEGRVLDTKTSRKGRHAYKRVSGSFETGESPADPLFAFFPLDNPSRVDFTVLNHAA